MHAFLTSKVWGSWDIIVSISITTPHEKKAKLLPMKSQDSIFSILRIPNFSLFIHIPVSISLKIRLYFHLHFSWLKCHEK